MTVLKNRLSNDQWLKIKTELQKDLNAAESKLIDSKSIFWDWFERDPEKIQQKREIQEKKQEINKARKSLKRMPSTIDEQTKIYENVKKLSSEHEKFQVVVEQLNKTLQERNKKQSLSEEKIESIEASQLDIETVKNSDSLIELDSLYEQEQLKKDIWKELPKTAKALGDLVAKKIDRYDFMVLLVRQLKKMPKNSAHSIYLQSVLKYFQDNFSSIFAILNEPTHPEHESSKLKWKELIEKHPSLYKSVLFGAEATNIEKLLAIKSDIKPEHPTESETSEKKDECDLIKEKLKARFSWDFETNVLAHPILNKYPRIKKEFNRLIKGEIDHNRIMTTLFEYTQLLSKNVNSKEDRKYFESLLDNYRRNFFKTLNELKKLKDPESAEYKNCEKKLECFIKQDSLNSLVLFKNNKRKKQFFQNNESEVIKKIRALVDIKATTSESLKYVVDQMIVNEDNKTNLSLLPPRGQKLGYKHKDIDEIQPENEYYHRGDILGKNGTLKFLYVDDKPGGVEPGLLGFLTTPELITAAIKFLREKYQSTNPDFLDWEDETKAWQQLITESDAVYRDKLTEVTTYLNDNRQTLELDLWLIKQDYNDKAYLESGIPWWLGGWVIDPIINWLRDLFYGDTFYVTVPEYRGMKSTTIQSLPVLVQNSITKFYVKGRADLPVEANKKAVREVLVNRIAKAWGAGAPEQYLLFGEYADGTPKIMTLSKWNDNYRSCSEPDSDFIIKGGDQKKGNYFVKKGENHVTDKIRGLNEFFILDAIFNDYDANKAENLALLKEKDDIYRIGVDRGHALESGRNKILETLDDDLKAKQPGTIKNLDIFYDSPLYERMKGVVFVLKFRGFIKETEKGFVLNIFGKTFEIDQVIDSYGAEFKEELKKHNQDDDIKEFDSNITLFSNLVSEEAAGSKKNQDYMAIVQDLCDTKHRYLAYCAKVLAIFQNKNTPHKTIPRYLLDVTELTLLDNLEKLFTPTHTHSPKGIKLKHLDKQSEKRVPWQMIKKDKKCQLICFDLSKKDDILFERGIEYLKLKIKEIKKDINLVEKNDSLIIEVEESELGELLKKLNESDIREYKKLSQEEKLIVDKFNLVKLTEESSIINIHTSSKSKALVEKLANKMNRLKGSEKEKLQSKINILIHIDWELAKQYIEACPKQRLDIYNNFPRHKKNKLFANGDLPIDIQGRHVNDMLRVWEEEYSAQLADSINLPWNTIQNAKNNLAPSVFEKIINEINKKEDKLILLIYLKQFGINSLKLPYLKSKIEELINELLKSNKILENTTSTKKIDVKIERKASNDEIIDHSKIVSELTQVFVKNRELSKSDPLIQDEVVKSRRPSLLPTRILNSDEKKEHQKTITSNTTQYGLFEFSKGLKHIEATTNSFLGLKSGFKEGNLLVKALKASVFIKNKLPSLDEVCMVLKCVIKRLEEKNSLTDQEYCENWQRVLNEILHVVPGAPHLLAMLYRELETKERDILSSWFEGNLDYKKISEDVDKEKRSEVFQQRNEGVEIKIIPKKKNENMSKSLFWKNETQENIDNETLSNFNENLHAILFELKDFYSKEMSKIGFIEQTLDEGNLVFMSIKEKQEINLEELKEISKEYHDKPILIKQGAKISIYGYYDTWKITVLNNKVFEKITFPAIGQYNLPSYSDVAPRIRQEIMLKRGHDQIDKPVKIEYLDSLTNIYGYQTLEYDNRLFNAAGCYKECFNKIQEQLKIDNVSLQNLFIKTWTIPERKQTFNEEKAIMLEKDISALILNPLFLMYKLYNQVAECSLEEGIDTKNLILQKLEKNILLYREKIEPKLKLLRECFAECKQNIAETIKAKILEIEDTIKYYNNNCVKSIQPSLEEPKQLFSYVKK